MKPKIRFYIKNLKKKYYKTIYKIFNQCLVIKKNTKKIIFYKKKFQKKIITPFRKIYTIKQGIFNKNKIIKRFFNYLEPTYSMLNYTICNSPINSFVNYNVKITKLYKKIIYPKYSIYNIKPKNLIKKFNKLFQTNLEIKLKYDIHTKINNFKIKNKKIQLKKYNWKNLQQLITVREEYTKKKLKIRNYKKLKSALKVRRKRHNRKLIFKALTHYIRVINYKYARMLKKNKLNYRNLNYCKLLYFFKKLKIIHYRKRWKFKKYKTKNFVNILFKRTFKRIKPPFWLKYKKKISTCYRVNQNLKKNTTFKVIHNYLFLNKHAVKSYFVKFFLFNKQTNNLKKKLKRKKKTFLFNFWKKKLTVYKKARITHWSLYTHKTLKKRRYKVFLSNYIRKFPNILEILISFFIIKFNLSFAFWNEFTQFYLEFFQKPINLKKIYQLPISFLFWDYLKYNKLQKNKIKKKIKKWIFRKKKIKRCFWMYSKKKIPCFFSKQTLQNKQQSNTVCFDYLTNYFYILDLKSINLGLKDVVYKNKLLKLHNFRYKS